MVKMGQDEHFLKHVCKIVDNLAQCEISTDILGPYCDDLIKIFLNYSQQSGRSIATINNCFTVIMNLIRCSNNQTICNTYIDYVLAHWSGLHGLGEESRLLFYSGFLTMIHVFLF